jgi:peptidoglycan/LPS O-acetylase OafA/YrhL
MVQRDTKPDLAHAEQRDARMNVTPLITGVGGAVYGGLAVWLVAVRRRRWTAAGLLAVGVGLLITMVTAGNHSHAEHLAVWLASCVLWAFLMVCVVMDARRPIGNETAGQER